MTLGRYSDSRRHPVVFCWWDVGTDKRKLQSIGVGEVVDGVLRVWAIDLDVVVPVV